MFSNNIGYGFIKFSLVIFMLQLGLTACKSQPETGNEVLPVPMKQGKLEAKALSFEVQEDSKLDERLEALAEDSEIIGFEIVAQPQRGTIGDLSATQGSFLYRPQADYAGQDSFTYRVKQGSRYSEVASVSLQVLPVNDTPRAKALNYTVSEDGTLVGQLTGTDVDSVTLSYHVSTNPSKGTVTVNATSGEFNYVPALNATGADTFAYRVQDGTLESDPALVSIEISSVNDRPTVENLEFQVAVGATRTIQAVGNDIEGSPLTYSLVILPTKGTASINATTGLITYQASATAIGTDEFSYKVHDGKNFSDPADVAVTLVAPALAGTWTVTNILRGTAAPCNGVVIEIQKVNSMLTILPHSITCGSSIYGFESNFSYDSSGQIFLSTIAAGSFTADGLVNINFNFVFVNKFIIEAAVGGGYQFTEQNGNGTFKGSIRRNY